MRILNDFAEAISQYEQSKGIPAGYRVDGREPYRFYMSNEAWSAMKSGMSEAARCQYEAGGGGELNGEPPKMAAFHSSSRMVYLLSKDWPGFVFEKRLPTIVGGTANLDGYVERNGRVFFVEAKCRELYDHKSPELVSNRYLDVYRYLAEKMPETFGYHADDQGNGHSSVTFYRNQQVVEGFDLKQMICHLLAVAASRLLEEQIHQKAYFLYVIYDPSALPLKPETREQILSIYKHAVEDANGFNMEKMFGHIVDYLVRSKKLEVRADVDTVKAEFRFLHCSHIGYSILPI